MLHFCVFNWFHIYYASNQQSSTLKMRGTRCWLLLAVVKWRIWLRYWQCRWPLDRSCRAPFWRK